MLSLLAITTLLMGFSLVRNYLALRRNIRIAQKTELPIVIVPLYTGTPLWYFCYSLILPAFKTLPKAWTTPWLDFLDPYWSWKLHHKPFARLGNDTIVIASPGGLQFCTCDPNIIVEVANRREDFCKPVESYVYLDLFGPSLITREGRSWRAHQRMLAPMFTERNARLVWDEAILQTQQMLESWLDNQNAKAKCIPDIREDTMTLAFHVINKAGFGVNMPWISKGNLSVHDDAAGSADTIGPGHRMTYREALHSAISHLFHIVIFPKWLLRIAPFQYATFLRTAHEETIGYLRELMVQKEVDLKRSQDSLDRQSGFDIMSALVSAKVERQKTNASDASKENPDSVEDEEALTERSILANVFLMLIAGHETTATVLLLTLVELAINVEWQQKVQENLDQIFGRRPHSSWSFQSDVTRLSDGMVGATINEVLRLYPPANIIPKGTRKGSVQTVRSGSHAFTIPENTALQFLAVSVHHNPKYWPSDPLSPGKEDLDEFRPQRWFSDVDSTLIPKSAGQRNPERNPRSEEGVVSLEMPTSLFRPHPGAYISFSTGHRGCIGRRFAQTEMLAVIAVIFRDYSLELDVEEFADDKTVENMSVEQRKAVYEKAKADTRRVTREGIRHHLTMQLKKGKLAIRLVRRGKERFRDARF